MDPGVVVSNSVPVMSIRGYWLAPNLISAIPCSVYRCICSSVYRSIHVSVHRRIYLQVYLSVGVLIDVYFHRCTCSLEYLSVGVSIRRYVYPAVCLPGGVSIRRCICTSLLRNSHIHLAIENSSPINNNTVPDRSTEE